MATFSNGGLQKKGFLETAPQYKVINFHDGMGNRLKRENFYVKAASVSEAGEMSKTQENGKSERQAAKKEAKQSKDDGDGEGGDALEKRKKKRKRQSIG